MTDHFLDGVAHFNTQRFWEAHESWETLWRAADPDLARFLQGLIQMAAAYHHVRRGTLRGAVRLFDASLEKLAGFPKAFGGLDRSNVEKAARLHRQWAADQIALGREGSLPQEEYPQLVLSSSNFDWRITSDR